MADSSPLIDDLPPRRICCEQCGASGQARAKFCWMCGAPVDGVPGTSPAPPSARSAAPREEPLAIWLAAWLALPLVAAVVYGLYLIDRLYAVLAGPALIVATAVTLIHGTIFRTVLRPKSRRERAAAATSSVLVWLITAAGTFAATMAVLAVMVIIMLYSIVVAMLTCFGLLR